MNFVAIFYFPYIVKKNLQLLVVILVLNNLLVMLIKD